MTVVYKCVNGHFRMKAHHFNTESPLLQFFYSFSVIGAYNVLFCILRMFYQYSHKLKTPILSFSNSWFAYRNKESGTFACVIKYAKLILKLLSKCGWYSYYNSLWCLKRYKTGILSGRNKKLTVAISANVLPQVFKVWGNYKNRKLLTAQSGDRKCKERASRCICEAWKVVSAAQTDWKPTTVTCEMRICGDRTGLNASVKLLSRAYLQRMWEAWHCWGGGGQNQPVWTSTVLWEPVSSITTGQLSLHIQGVNQCDALRSISVNTCWAFLYCI